ncbi:Histidine decarboxylase [Gryllus bimaculatus]|nr:Histidine decarboxylase [Gryllus bimaculatus]
MNLECIACCLLQILDKDENFVRTCVSRGITDCFFNLVLHVTQSPSAMRLVSQEAILLVRFGDKVGGSKFTTPFCITSPKTTLFVYNAKGKEMVDYIADYLENIRQRRVYPAVAPGYLRALLPDSAPEEPESWDSIMNDVERCIMPGMTHWQSPHMHAYFPALNSFPSLLGDMLADAINCLGFTWASSPACTELETIVMNWLGRAINLPESFLHLQPDSPGGGVIQTTASEATLVSLLAGRTEALRRLRHHGCCRLQDAELNSRLVAYTSDQAHSSVEKAALIGLVRMRFLESDAALALRGDTLRAAVLHDRAKGLVPFYVCATLGTTGACSFDNLNEIGPICEKEGMWLHVDAAYAGTAFLCPEYRCWLSGVHYAHSFAFNPSKWMMVHFDCTAMWVKNSAALHRTFNHWQIPLSKRFRALKLWFVLRSYGIKGLQAHVRENIDTKISQLVFDISNIIY